MLGTVNVQLMSIRSDPVEREDDPPAFIPRTLNMPLQIECLLGIPRDIPQGSISQRIRNNRQTITGSARGDKQGRYQVIEGHFVLPLTDGCVVTGIAKGPLRLAIQHPQETVGHPHLVSPALTGIVTQIIMGRQPGEAVLRFTTTGVE